MDSRHGLPDFSKKTRDTTVYTIPSDFNLFVHAKKNRCKFYCHISLNLSSYFSSNQKKKIHRLISPSTQTLSNSKTTYSITTGFSTSRTGKKNHRLTYDLTIISILVSASSTTGLRNRFGIFSAQICPVAFIFSQVYRQHKALF